MSLLKHSVFNLAGYVLPTLVAIPSMGILARSLGTNNFGLFTLAFALVGYASIFDAGLSRAVIREISIHRDNVLEQRNIIGSATIAVLFLGVLAAAIIYLFSFNILLLLNVPKDMLVSANDAFKLLSLIVPVYLLNQVWIAYLEGLEQFGNINIQRSISNSAIAAFPALFSYIGDSLYYAVLGLFFGRLISLLISFYFSRNIIIESKLRFESNTFIRLIKFGGWITLSNIISPLMVYFDRFLVSHLLGVGKVAFYAAPSEIISRLLIVPAALARALFPKLSNLNSTDNKVRLEKLSYIVVISVCFPLVIIVGAFADKILTLWMGNDYSGQPAIILQILLIGFFFNSIAQIPFAKIQALGKSRTTATVHFVEIIPYILLLYFLTINYSLLGTALAWSIRVIIDFIILYILSRR